MGAARGSGRPGFILLYGCPRSGTTLLAQHFGSALNVAMPIETHFIPHFARYLRLWGDVTKPSRQRNLLEAMAAYTRIWIYRGIRAQVPDRHATVSLLPVLEQMQPVAGGFAQVLEAAYRKYAEAVELPYFGDKSAPFEPTDLSLYDRSIDNLKVIHMIRDGRDVSRSWRAHWFGPRTAGEAAWLWRRHIESARAWARRNDDRYLEVRYEDFIAEPQSALNRIATFLGLPAPRSDSVKDVLGRVLSNEPTHIKLGETVDPGNTGGWRHLPHDDVKLIEFVAGGVLKACGYSVVTAEFTSTESAKLYARYGMGLMSHFVSGNFYMRRARALMPAIFRLMQLLGVSVEAVSCSIAGVSSRTG